VLRVAVAEDQLDSREKLAGFLSRYQEEGGFEISYDLFADGSELIKHYQKQYDVILLDIEMPQMDGMKTAELIREQDNDVILVFITNVAQYAVKGYEYQAYDYILKPVEYDVFMFKMQRIVTLAKQNQDNSIIINGNDRVYKIRCSDIIFAEVIGHHVIYHTIDGDIEVYGSMKSAEEKLEGQNFSKCNSCYLVNFRHVQVINGNSVVLGKDKPVELAISRSRKKEFTEAVIRYFGGI